MPGVRLDRGSVTRCGDAAAAPSPDEDYVVCVMTHLARPRVLAALPAALLLLAACGTVSVTPSRSGFRAAPRGPECAIEFLRNPPDRAYDEIADVYSYFPRVVEPHGVLRATACELGADAVIVTRDFVISTLRTPDRKLVAGTAIKYRDAGILPEPRG